MRRTFAGLVFGLAYACASLAVSGFMLQRTAFDPGSSAAAADVVLGDNAIKAQLVDIIATAASGQLGLDPTQVRQTVELVADHPDGQKILAEVIHDAHAHLIGEQPEPVQITPDQLVLILRTQAAAALPAITLPVPKITALDITRKILDWMVPLAAIATVILIVLGIFAHPEKPALLRSLALGLVLLALLVGLLGYIVPRLVIPLLDSSPWANVSARLADDSLPLVIGMELVLIGGALALFAGSGMINRRRRWNTPVSSYRYSEDRRWSV